MKPHPLRSDLYPSQICFHHILNLSDSPTMKLQLTLVLICVLFPKALTLKCYQCIPASSGTCNTQTCPDQCGSATAEVTMSGVSQVVSVKNCTVSGQCLSGSLNIGFEQLTINTQCCSTDLCNSQNVSALSHGTLNGNKCYTCIGKDCTGTVSCVGIEDRCITATAIYSSGSKVTVKGCVSRSFCTVDTSILQATGVTGSVSCCEGNLCNSAEGVKLSLLIMLVPLISILFI
ncbi:phospholipase A2 inhibitor and Ly6/PLAUR domain-containing protein-like isoform X1 [Pygocentrus nattereri]|uniref:UPAR/Ly6 domain-containing protein n=1 Tax=Pygocentrus nattereri TaxID=42514 RepID=A0A3B4EFL5_PYGNA|nr:phospholipase A2 inhibitor and Ly6/PLAUR domain-containing protein-like isoform X1 [Pygocentrus nattereri]